MKEKIKQVHGFEEKWKTEEKVKAILNWSFLNSVKENQKYFLQNAKLAAIHLDNVKDMSSIRADSTLKGMYSRKTFCNSVAELSERMLMRFNHEEFNQLSEIKKSFQKYGRKMEAKLPNLGSVYER